MLDALGESARDKNGRVVLPLKKREIAQLIAVDPATFSRLLRGVAAEGPIRLDGQWIVVPDVEKVGKSG